MGEEVFVERFIENWCADLHDAPTEFPLPGCTVENRFDDLKLALLEDRPFLGVLGRNIDIHFHRR